MRGTFPSCNRSGASCHRCLHFLISILLEEDIAHLPATEHSIGADLGLKSFVVLSDGEVVGNPRFFACGHILSTLPLDVRAWTCPECHSHHDRDVNIAKNIHAVGLTV